MNHAKLLFDLAALKRNERQPPAKLRALQEKKLRALLACANARSPYYRAAFRGFENDAGEREFLHPLAVEGFCIEGLLDYQFRQTGNASFTLLAETAKNAARETIRDEMRKQMGEILAEKGLNYVDFKIDFTDHISPDPLTGKKRLIVPMEERSSASARPLPTPKPPV